jgi:glycosyltransferase involved in cell wall biosynthesis
MRILYIAHNHPHFRPGGSEIFAHDLFSEVKRHKGIRAFFLACTTESQRSVRPGTLFQTVGRSADEMLLWVAPADPFNLSQGAPDAMMPELEQLFLEFKPDIVHFHHYVLIGLEALVLTRRCLPNAKLILTLHDYYAICPADGMMLTEVDKELCERATADACRACFPKRRADQFVLRRLNALLHFGVIDNFVSPSHFLRQRYIAWGLPAERIEVLPNGRPMAEPPPPRDTAQRNAFAYFGNLSEAKGILIVLKAAKRLVDSGFGNFTLDVFGAAPGQSEAFLVRLDEAFATAPSQVNRRGAYQPDEMGRHLAEIDWVIVPSIWWENAPLVITEALLHARPVICSGVGGMAEMVADGETGLHFHVADPNSLANTMRRAFEEVGLWDSLSNGLPSAARAAMTIEAVAKRHLALYSKLLVT